ncbi:glycosyltransferase family 9 protein [Tissierella pigra]|nr:glycosyltransferase family 9 protein [Tissierella pigra]
MKYNKILIEIHHGLGDVVQIIPLINNLRKNFTEAKISVIVASSIHAEILDCTGLVDTYYFLNLRNMKFNEIIKFIRQIRRENYDIGILSPISNRRLGAILLYILGCKNRVGEVSKADKRLLIKNNITMDGDNSLHKVDRNLNLLKPLDITIYDSKPFMNINKGNEENAKNKLDIFDKKDKLIGICIGTNPVEQKKGFNRIPYEAKKWEIENYMELIERLTNDFNIILLGGKKEEQEIKEYEEKLKDNKNVINYINKTTIMESAALINECDLVIGGDTGMLHIADALGKYTLTIFGPTDPKIVGPYSEKSNNITLNIDCQYCYGTDKLFECNNRKCLNDITVEQIYNKAIEILN